MKILGINTSPRQNSNCRIALEKALDTAKAEGAEVELVDSNKLNIKACQGDNYCKAHEGKCAVDDDMQQVYKKIEEADGIIFAIPVYFFDVNAQMKLVLDRLYSYFQFPFTETYGKKKVSFIISQGTPDPDAFKAVLQTQFKAFEFLGFELADFVVLTDNNVPGAINDKEDQLAQVVEVGKNIL
ncbi:flavodoxin family protein [Methanosphaera sp. ISO3-F5]|uniref:flavodoxin family protein n=1 Tax=Methanosphaera sp. ISO3-F5 TaxID=1452353 RepID=UPI002B25A70E|nr:flavodoxin family protein [Methanosphaera sp. ISO3-F5]WQH64601.1 flavodoxin family protein [Methanosphaera sp. ISO3-F5]